MEAQWQADRAMLRTLLRTQPTWTQHDYAESIGRSLAWVKKWTKRLRAAVVATCLIRPSFQPGSD